MEQPDPLEDMLSFPRATVKGKKSEIVKKVWTN